MLKIDEILMMIRPQPFAKILEIGCGQGVVTNALAEHIASANGEIDLFELSTDKNGKKDFVTKNNVNLKVVPDPDNSIKVMSGYYETVVLTLAFDKIEEPVPFLKKCYRSMSVLSTFIALCHEERDDNEKIESFLDEAHFTNMNRIDMRDGYFLATAKKLYNWDESIR